jgi:hypothetical protein
MKVIIILIGLVFCMTGKSQQNPVITDIFLSENIDYNFSENMDFNKKENIREAFNSTEGVTKKPEFEIANNLLEPSVFKNSKQDQNFHAFMNVGFFGTSKGNVPFWMRSMKSGSIPTDGISVSLIGGAFKEYNTETKKLVDWGAGFEGRANAGTNSELILIEAYTKLRFSIFEIKGGRFREHIGLVDSTLSTGAFSLSGNALGVPKIEAGIANYWNVPLTKGFIAIKGNFAHGWMDKQILRKNIDTTPVPHDDAYFHQLSAYGRIGKHDSKIRLFGGLNHLVVWGLENELYSNWGLSDFETFKYVIMGKPFGKNNIPTSKVGNHVGTIDQAMEWETEQILFAGYHQFFYDVGALATFANAKDGLWGISLKNKQTKTNNFHWNKFLFEFMYSKSQGGEIDSKPRASGAEDYYNNFEYYNGWSYKGENMGNTLFTSKKYLRDGFPTLTRQYFSNNRIIAYHGGAEFDINNWYCKGLLTYTLNYGTYTTSTGERGLGSTIHLYNPPYFPKSNQFSVYFESYRILRNGMELRIQLAFDKGDLLYNSVGSGISLTKRW